MDGQEKVLSLWAYLVVDDDGTEAVPALEVNGSAFPLMGADLAMIAMMRPHAVRITQELGKSVTLAHFSVRTDQERLEPGGSVTKL